MQSAWRVYLVSALIAAVVAAGTACLTASLLQLWTGQPPTTTTLEGVAEVPWGAELDVYYKVPFSSPPTLTFPLGLHDTQCRVVDQKANSFKLQREKAGLMGPAVTKVKWMAEGQPAR